MKRKVKELYCFASTVIAVVDEHGEQIPELQATSLISAWAERAESLGYDPEGMLCNFPGLNRLKLTRWNDGWRLVDP